MNTILEIAEKLAASETILLFPHVHMDGDALGSSAALCRVLRRLGKNAYIPLEDEIAENLNFLDDGFCVSLPKDAKLSESAACASDGTANTESTADAEFVRGLFGSDAFDLSLAVDCGDASRFPRRANVFARGAESVCLDHHMTSQPFCNLNYIDPQAAATAEIVYDVIRALERVTGKTLLDPACGEALFAAIATDTGNFQYSNTTARTHRIAAELIEAGIDFNTVCVALYQNVRPSRMRLSAAATSQMKLFADGRAAMTTVTRGMARDAGAEMSEADGIVETLRNLAGVEISVLLKEGETEGEVRVSMRAKSTGNVADIAARFGGGGHIKAAGCTLRGMTLAEAEARMTEEVTRALEDSASKALAD